VRVWGHQYPLGGSRPGTSQPVSGCVCAVALDRIMHEAAEFLEGTCVSPLVTGPTWVPSRTVMAGTDHAPATSPGAFVRRRGGGVASRGRSFRRAARSLGGGQRGRAVGPALGGWGGRRGSGRHAGNRRESGRRGGRRRGPGWPEWLLQSRQFWRRGSYTRWSSPYYTWRRRALGQKVWNPTTYFVSYPGPARN
jgi:hypothetical protein